MTDFHVIYDFSNALIKLQGVKVATILLFGGILVVLYGSTLKSEKSRKGPFAFWGLKNKRFSLTIGWIFIVVSSLTGILIVVLQIDEYLTTDEIYKNKAFSTVEGCIENFWPEPAGGHKKESFQIGETKFEYSSYDDTNYGYNKTALKGGLLEENRRARVSFFTKGKQNIILKLELGGVCE